MEQYVGDEHVDSLLVWSNGKVRHEIYRNGQTRRDRHIVFSVTKSFTGLLAYADATVRHVLDMEVGIDFSEVYDDPQSDIRQFTYASGMRAVPDGVAAHHCLYDYLPTLRKRGEHGHDFHYVTANSEVLGWVIERGSASPRPSLWGNEGGGNDCSYRSQWYSFHPGRTLYAMGIHGQSIFVSTERDSAMVVQSSAPVADGDFFDVAANLFAAVTDHLANA